MHKEEQAGKPPTAEAQARRGTEEERGGRSSVDRGSSATVTVANRHDKKIGLCEPPHTGARRQYANAITTFAQDRRSGRKSPTQREVPPCVSSLSSCPPGLP